MGPVRGEVFWSGLITYLCEKRPDFVRYLSTEVLETNRNQPLFLACSKEAVNSYLERVGESFGEKVSEFVGEFAKETDLEQATESGLVFYGNHLFNHYVPILMSDEDLVKSFSKNRDELKKYSNYKDMFSFPFGQRKSCFSERQVDLLLNSGASRIFGSSGTINYDASMPYLERIALNSCHLGPTEIWFQIFKHRLMNFLQTQK